MILRARRRCAGCGPKVFGEPQQGLGLPYCFQTCCWFIFSQRLRLILGNPARCCNFSCTWELCDWDHLFYDCVLFFWASSSFSLAQSSMLLFFPRFNRMNLQALWSTLRQLIGLFGRFLHSFSRTGDQIGPEERGEFQVLDNYGKSLNHPCKIFIPAYFISLLSQEKSKQMCLQWINEEESQKWDFSINRELKD